MKEKFENTDYLSRFPTNFNSYLSEKKHLDRFNALVDFSYEEKIVYRGIHSGYSLTKEDFLCTIDAAEYYELESSPTRTLENFGVSVNDSIGVLEFQMKFPNKKLKLYAVAKGKMKCCYGPATFDEDRPHHNWFLFNGSSEKLVSEFVIEKTYE